MSKVAVDTNVLVYIIATDERKHEIAKSLLAERPIISTQVVSEFLNVVKRQIKSPKLEVFEKCTEWLSFGEIFSVNINTLRKSLLLIKKYDFQIFDAIIVASAIEAGCKILYSEDLQHGLVVENQLTIINPFRIE